MELDKVAPRSVQVAILFPGSDFSALYAVLSTPSILMVIGDADTHAQVATDERFSRPTATFRFRWQDPQDCK